MTLNDTQRALTTKCLWELQENCSEIREVLLLSIGGLILATTMQRADSAQRLSAVSAALFLLGEHASAVWTGGQANEVLLRFTAQPHPTNPQDKVVAFAQLSAVGHTAVLLVVYEQDSQSAAPQAHIRKAVAYLEALLHGQTPPPIKWR
jgi:predicted regulator of Ras-like GTPase activity (Roadblock/LC7/MglB family)